MLPLLDSMKERRQGWTGRTRRGAPEGGPEREPEPKRAEEGGAGARAS
jgi:hypothetical protein